MIREEYTLPLIDKPVLDSEDMTVLRSPVWGDGTQKHPSERSFTRFMARVMVVLSPSGSSDAATQQAIANLQSELAAQKMLITSLQNTNSSLTERLTTAEGAISTANGAIASLQTRATNAETRLSAAEGKISSLENTATTLGNRVATLEQKVAAQEQEIVSLKLRLPKLF